jgi:hypothetical protein
MLGFANFIQKTTIFRTIKEEKLQISVFLHPAISYDSRMSMD